MALGLILVSRKVKQKTTARLETSLFETRKDKEIHKTLQNFGHWTLMHWKIFDKNTNINKNKTSSVLIMGNKFILTTLDDHARAKPVSLLGKVQNP